VSPTLAILHLLKFFIGENRMKFIKLKLAATVLAALGTMLATSAQAEDTIAKVKASGSITMGVRDSSGALSYTNMLATMLKFANVSLQPLKK
jgi:hypothetical protein